MCQRTRWGYCGFAHPDPSPPAQPHQERPQTSPALPSAPRQPQLVTPLPSSKPRSWRHLAKLYNCKQSVTALFVIILHLKEQDELNELIKWLPVKARAALHRRPAGPARAHAYGGWPRCRRPWQRAGSGPASCPVPQDSSEVKTCEERAFCLRTLDETKTTHSSGFMPHFLFINKLLAVKT